jgi:hypothetical protein
LPVVLQLSRSQAREDESCTSLLVESTENEAIAVPWSKEGASEEDDGDEDELAEAPSSGGTSGGGTAPLLAAELPRSYFRCNQMRNQREAQAGTHRIAL